MAPEILEGEENYNYKCDLWSVGIIIYRLIFKDAPYKGETDRALLQQINKFGTNKLKKTNDKELDDLIIKLLKKDPAKRLDWDGYLNHPFFNKSEFLQKIEMRKIVPLIGMINTGKSRLLSVIYNLDLLFSENQGTKFVNIIRYNPKINEPCFYHLKIFKKNDEYYFYIDSCYNAKIQFQ
jgi:serine/threonine protein kinase